MANIRYQQVVSNIAQLANREKYDFDFIYVSGSNFSGHRVYI